MEQVYCGVDIGGTKLSVGLIDEKGAVLHRRSVEDHAALDENGMMDKTAAEIRALCKDASIGVQSLYGVGVGMAGHIRQRDGTVLTTSNLQGFKMYPVAAELTKRLGVRVILDNDANCQALAEHRFGAGRGFRDMVFITVSTGIGAGIILNNRLHRGHSGIAGEIGHCIIEPGSDSICTCGNRGCFMAHACTLNLNSLVARKRSGHANSRILTHLPGEKTAAASVSGRQRGALAIDGKLIHHYAESGDPLALEIVDEYAGYLGILLYNIFQFIDPAAIVMGGGLMNWGDRFFTKMTGTFYTLAEGMIHEEIAIVKSVISEDSGIIGAAVLLLDEEG